MSAKTLSILTPSLVCRAKTLEKMMAFFAAQMRGLPVELLVDVDDYVRTTGAKRNSLLARAEGEYVVFCDDDDEFSPKYVESVLACLESKPDVVGINGKVRFPSLKHWGGPPVQTFVHSIKYKTYFRDKNGVYCRPPTHSNPMRRDFMMSVPFPDVSLFEDVAQAVKLAASGVLKTEVMCEEPLFTYIPAGTGSHAGHANQPTPADRERIMKEYGCYT